MNSMSGVNGSNWNAGHQKTVQTNHKEKKGPSSFTQSQPSMTSDSLPRGIRLFTSMNIGGKPWSSRFCNPLRQLFVA
jgi:hypothetical protein